MAFRPFRMVVAVPAGSSFSISDSSAGRPVYMSAVKVSPRLSLKSPWMWTKLPMFRLRSGSSMEPNSVRPRLGSKPMDSCRFFRNPSAPSRKSKPGSLSGRKLVSFFRLMVGISRPVDGSSKSKSKLVLIENRSNSPSVAVIAMRSELLS